VDYQSILDEIEEEIKPLLTDGNVANYIPALAKADPLQFAMTLTLFDGRTYSVGCTDTKFSIQSISKVFTFTQSLSLYGPIIYNRVGKEPSGNPFNSLIQLEYENGKPRNPFINAGAIVITDSLYSHYKNEEDTFMNILQFTRDISNNDELSYNNEVWKSECEYGFRNIALANLMKSFGNFENDIDPVIKTYFKHCSIEMSTFELSRAMLFLANHGVDPITQKRFITQSQAKRINALMLTCGHYDASGEFAFHVGLPGKSGVGGGIVAIVPDVMSIAVFSPSLNSWGNSLAGTKALELFTNKTTYSIF
jgi:glutaminase